MEIRYHFYDLVKNTIEEFCSLALPGVQLPDCVEYEVSAHHVDCGYDELISCFIKVPDGHVFLSFNIYCDWSTPDGSGRSPVIRDLDAVRVVKGENGINHRYGWDAEPGRWKIPSCAS